MAGKFSRIVAILKSAPRQIVSAYQKGKSDAPAVPLPDRAAQASGPASRSPGRQEFTP